MSADSPTLSAPTGHRSTPSTLTPETRPARGLARPHGTRTAHTIRDHHVHRTGSSCSTVRAVPVVLHTERAVSPPHTPDTVSRRSRRPGTVTVSCTLRGWYSRLPELSPRVVPPLSHSTTTCPLSIAPERRSPPETAPVLHGCSYSRGVKPHDVEGTKQRAYQCSCLRMECEGRAGTCDADPARRRSRSGSTTSSSGTQVGMRSKPGRRPPTVQPSSTHRGSTGLYPNVSSVVTRTPAPRGHGALVGSDVFRRG